MFVVHNTKTTQTKKKQKKKEFSIVHFGNYHPHIDRYTYIQSVVLCSSLQTEKKKEWPVEERDDDDHDEEVEGEELPTRKEQESGAHRVFQ